MQTHSPRNQGRRLGLDMLHPGNLPSGMYPINRNGMMPAPAVQPVIDPSEIAIVVIGFETKYKQPPARPIINPDDPPPAMIEEDWVEWVKLGDQMHSTTREAIHRLRGDDKRGIPARIEWYIVGPAYEAWKRGETEVPVNGTPLFTWSGISRELANVLKGFDIYTIEALANYPDHSLQRIPVPGIRELRRKAQLTVEAREISDFGALLAERDLKLDMEREARLSLEDQLRSMQGMVAALQANQAAAASTLGGTPGAHQPHPDDEFVERGPGDTPVGSSSAPTPATRQRRKPSTAGIDAIGGGTDFIDLGGQEG